MEEAFDTLEFTKRAISAGLTKDVAEFHAEELFSAINKSLVTREHLKNQLQNLENRLIWKLLGGISLIVGTFFTISQILKWTT